jgi:hypothetical protein
MILNVMIGRIEENLIRLPAIDAKSGTIQTVMQFAIIFIMAEFTTGFFLNL